MEGKGLRNNYIIAVLELIAFIVIFCFLYAYSKELWLQLKGSKMDLVVLGVGVFSSLFFYAFVADLNNLYKNIQNFFFRTNILSFIFSSLLVILALVYFLVPRIFGASLNENLFTFLSGFLFTSHLAFVARNQKAGGFTGYVNYLFVFSMLYMLNLILWTVYLIALYDVSLISIITDGSKEGFSILTSLFRKITT